jgi:hypothetical protein
MEEHWEHKIREAYIAKDTNTIYPNRNKLWNTISNEMIKPKGVAPFWKVAAIFFALLMFSSAFAAVLVLKTQNLKILKTEEQNLKLQHTVDSLLSIKPEKTAEIKIIEKEKIVYKTIEKQPDKTDHFNSSIVGLEKDLNNLSELLEQSKLKVKSAKDSLNFAMMELERYHMDERVDPSEKDTEIFKLKTEKALDEITTVKKDLPQKLKIQIFDFHENIQYDPNSSLLKK